MHSRECNAECLGKTTRNEDSEIFSPHLSNSYGVFTTSLATPKRISEAMAGAKIFICKQIQKCEIGFVRNAKAVQNQSLQFCPSQQKAKRRLQQVGSPHAQIINSRKSSLPENKRIEQLHKHAICFSATASMLDRNNEIMSPGLSAEKIAELETIAFAPASAALSTVEGAMPLST